MFFIERKKKAIVKLVGKVANQMRKKQKQKKEVSGIFSTQLNEIVYHM